MTISSVSTRGQPKDHLVRPQRWKHIRRILAGSESLENHLSHADVEVRPAHKVKLAVECCDRPRVVVLNLQVREYVSAVIESTKRFSSDASAIVPNDDRSDHGLRSKPRAWPVRGIALRRFHAVLECAQRGLSTLAEGDDDLFVRHVGDVARGVDSLCACSPVGIN